VKEVVNRVKNPLGQNMLGTECSSLTLGSLFSPTATHWYNCSWWGGLSFCCWGAVPCRCFDGVPLITRHTRSNNPNGNSSLREAIYIFYIWNKKEINMISLAYRWTRSNQGKVKGKEGGRWKVQIVPLIG